MRSVNENLNTNGVGYWSMEAREVRVVGIDVPYANEEQCFHELRVYFDTRTWDTEKHGLIYTDQGFLVELKKYLFRAGYDSKDVHYSEQGMQGDNYVSFDVGKSFLKTWKVTRWAPRPL